MYISIFIYTARTALIVLAARIGDRKTGGEKGRQALKCSCIAEIKERAKHKTEEEGGEEEKSLKESHGSKQFEVIGLK